MQAKHKEAPAKYTANWLESLDGRTAIAQEIHARYQSLTSDLGGEESLSYQQRALVSRTLFVELSIQQQEQSLAGGGDLDSGRYTQQVNTLLGLLKTLGLERKGRKVTDLQTFIQRKGGQA